MLVQKILMLRFIVTGAMQSVGIGTTAGAKQEP